MTNNNLLSEQVTIKTRLQTSLNADFWGVNPCFKRLACLLKQRNVTVGEYETRINGSDITSIGTPTIVVFKGVRVGNDNDIEETEMRDLIVSHDPRRNLGEPKTEPELPDEFLKVSQISRYAASFLRAKDYAVNVSVVYDLDEIRQIDFDLDSGIRFDLIDPRTVDPEILRKELGLNW